MYSYASLLAEEYVVRDLIKSATATEMLTENIYKVKTDRQTFYTKVNELSPKQAQQLLKNLETLQSRSRLLNRGLLSEEEQYELAVTIIELNAESLIRAETLWNKEVIFSYKNTQVKIQLDPELRSHEYEVLCLNKALTEGYKFKEVAGRHFLVTTPNKRLRVVTRYGCDCYEFDNNHDCLHHRATLAFLKHRDLTNELRQIEFR